MSAAAVPAATAAAGTTAYGAVVPSILVSTGAGAGGLLSGGAATIGASTLASAASTVMPYTALGTASVSGGLLGGLSSAFNTIRPYMSLVSAGSSVLQGYNAYRTGQAQSSIYKLQAMELAAKKETMKLNALREGNLAYRKYLQAQSSAIAYGAAGGVNPFSGSALLTQTVGGKRLGVDIQTLDYNNAIGQTFADAQRNMLTIAGDNALTGSYYDGLSSIGQAIYTYEKTRTPE